MKQDKISTVFVSTAVAVSVCVLMSPLMFSLRSDQRDRIEKLNERIWELEQKLVELEDYKIKDQVYWSLGPHLVALGPGLYSGPSYGMGRDLDGFHLELGKNLIKVTQGNLIVNRTHYGDISKGRIIFITKNQVFLDKIPLEPVKKKPEQADDPA